MEPGFTYIAGKVYFHLLKNYLLIMWKDLWCNSKESDSRSKAGLTLMIFVCLCWGFTAQSTQWGHVERGQFT